MYWSRTGSPLDLAAWLLLLSLCWAGGWLLSAHLFGLRSRERLMSGLATGLLLFILLANLLAQLLPLSVAFWASALIVLSLGVLAAPQRRNHPSAWNYRSAWFAKSDLEAWPQLLAFVGLLALFTLVNRGLAIFDDYQNLPLLSRIAAGDMPPHFYLNPTQPLAYHYGLHLFAASLVRIGGFYPWSAFDLVKAVSLALTLMLGWLWFTRVTRRDLAGLFGVVLLLFGSGMRWLLLFAPQKWLDQVGSRLQFLGSAVATAPNLSTALVSPWKIEGGGPLPFPFAFANGIFPPLHFAIAGSGALPQMTIILMLLLAHKSWRPYPGLVFSLLLASLALTAEHSFVLVWGGILLAVLAGSGMRRRWRDSLSWAWALLPALILALLAGGVITGLVLGWATPVQSTAEEQGLALSSFSLRWPPALLSAHLGSLSLLNPGQLLVALAEAGLAILLSIWVTRRAWLILPRRDWVYAGLGIAALVGFIVPIFVRYGVERDISRLTGSALFIWLLLGAPILWFATLHSERLVRGLLVTGYASVIVAGLALFATQLIAISRPQLTYFVDEPDALLSRALWDRLEPDASILDPLPIRAVTLFGRDGGASHQDIYTPLPEWLDLLENIDPSRLAQAGYAYLYMDKSTWQALSPEQKTAFQTPCVKRLAEQSTDTNEFRWLLEVRTCQ